MYKTFIVVLSSLFLATTSNFQISLSQETNKRSSQYYARRVFTIRYGFTPDEEDAVKAQAREFLWKSWRQQKLAYCAVTWTNMEGEPTTHNFYIGPGEGGRWHVLVEVEYDCCWHNALEGKERKRESLGTKTYHIMERVEPGSGRVISEKEDCAPTNYLLRLSEPAPKEGGAVVTRLL